ncbi:MAG: hypothetical protein LC539_12845, partial [Candidatus Thiodiazotropha sp.]|nr:hypothetical protein [Candidatus Thiodiazotropha sp.]
MKVTTPAWWYCRVQSHPGNPRRPEGSALGVRPEGSALGVRPEGSALGVRPEGSALGVRPE